MQLFDTGNKKGDESPYYKPPVCHLYLNAQSNSEDGIMLPDNYLDGVENKQYNLWCGSIVLVEFSIIL